MFRIILVATFLTGGLAFSYNLEGRIVNGTDAEPGDVPYIVSIRSSSGSHSCGGSIIRPNWILTAAHCAQRPAKDITIQYGRLNISSAVDSSVIAVIQVINHENYSASLLRDDIALLKLAKNITYTDLIKPAKLPNQGQATPGGSPALLAGWGYPYTGGTVMKRLQKVNISIVANPDCAAVHGSGRIFDSNICAGVPGGGKGQCSGDSGGPLTVRGEVVGLVSWSIKPCTVAPYPGVFTRVSSFIDWIEKKIS